MWGGVGSVVTAATSTPLPCAPSPPPSPALAPHPPPLPIPLPHTANTKQASRRYAPPELGTSIAHSLRRSVDGADTLRPAALADSLRSSGTAGWGADSARDLRDSIESLASLRLRGDALDAPSWDEWSGRLQLR
jgi:hypothetical protein